MNNKKVIIYLHGFGSSGQSGTVKHLRKIFPKYNVLAPDIPVNPVAAIPFLKKYCEENQPDVIIGTSMGGMYAMQMYDYKRICVNPALRMSELTNILKPGTFEYFQPTQSGETHFTITDDTIWQFREMEAHMFDGVNDENCQCCWGFFGDEDTTVNCREEFEDHFAPNVQMFHGGHRMNNKILDEVILPFVENLLKGNKTIEEYALRGDHHDVMEALTLLTKAYIKMCGYSLGYRTIVYCAGEGWKERLAWLDLPLSEMARKEPLVTLMPNITNEYDPKIYDKYDISGMQEEELIDGCKQAINDKEFDEATIEVLCWGLMKTTEKKEVLSQEIEANAPDGTHLKGILTEQNCGCTSVTMTSPYNNLNALTIELVRDARDLLIKAYEDYQNLYKQEDKIRELFPKYQEILRKNKTESRWKKHMLFDKVYGQLVDDTVIVSPQKLFGEWFGLEFYDDNSMHDPSWM